jgi:hypothetical protein
MLKLGHFALCALVLLPLAAIAQTPTPSMAQTETANERNAQVTAIEQVMKQYHEAVVSHNGSALSALFLPDANIWLNVLTDGAYDQAQAKRANDPKVRVSRYRDFAKVVSSTPKAFNPKHSNASSIPTAPSRLSFSIMFLTSMGNPNIAAANPGNW